MRKLGVYTAVAVALAAGGLRAGPAWAACPDVVGTITTCHTGDVVDPAYDAPGVLTLRLLGDTGLLTAGELQFSHRTAALPTPAPLTFSTGGQVTIAAAPVDPTHTFLLTVFNESGVNAVTIANGTTLSGNDWVLMLDSEATSALATDTSVVVLDGRIVTQNSATPVTPGGQYNGIRNQVAGGASVRTQIGATGVVDLSAVAGAAAPTARMFGVYTNALNGGNATIESLGSVRVVASANYQAGGDSGGVPGGAALYSVSESGASTINAGGSILVDNRAFATPAATSAVLARVEGGAAAATLNLSGTVETFGLDTAGASAFHYGTGNIVMTAAPTGSIVTHGDRSTGVVGQTFGSGNINLQTGAVTTSGRNADGVLAQAGGGAVQVTATGAINVSGEGSRGIAALSSGGGAVAATINGAVTASGHNSAALVARSAGAVNVQVGASGALVGGWSALPTDVDATTTTGAAGLLIETGAGQTATVGNLGSLSAANDRALALIGAGPLALTNGGTIAGTLSLAGADDVVTNAAQWVLRNAVDTNGDGTRDTKRIATVDFGGGNDVFRNEAAGVIRLAQVQNAATVQADRQYLPDLMPPASHAVTTPGIEQAHFVGLERFENRGLLTLRDMEAGGAAPVAGDVLLITSGSVAANGVLTPGAAPGVFVADGGTLALDTVLNAGGASSQTDLLVVDSVALGPNGPTRVLVSNAGGLGALTLGDGIKVVDVLGGAPRSAAGAFSLGAPVVAGAFSYRLFRSGVSVDDGDWYLRSEAVVVPPPPGQPPPQPPPGQPPPGTPVPTYRPEAALFAALPEFLRNVDVSAPGSRQARLGDEAGGLTVARRGRVWARYIRRDIDTAQQGTVAPSSSGEARGYQFGVELYGGRDEAAAQIGLYGGRLDAEATIRGFSNGVQNTPVGRLEPSVTYAGVYVSRARGRGLYFDTVLQYGVYDGEAITFADGQRAPIKGTGGYASLETGYDFAVLPRLVVEPQLQIATQPQRVRAVTIVNARVEQSPANTLAGRAGLRVRGELGSGAWRLQPYVGASLWHGLDHQDQTRFSGNGAVQTTLLTDTRLRAFEYSGGFSLVMGSHLMAFGEYSKLDSRGDAGLRHDATTFSGGLRLAW